MSHHSTALLSWHDGVLKYGGSADLQSVNIRAIAYDQMQTTLSSVSALERQLVQLKEEAHVLGACLVAKELVLDSTDNSIRSRASKTEHEVDETVLDLTAVDDVATVDRLLRHKHGKKAQPDKRVSKRQCRPAAPKMSMKAGPKPISSDLKKGAAIRHVKANNKRTNSVNKTMSPLASLPDDWSSNEESFVVSDEEDDPDEEYTPTRC